MPQRVQTIYDETTLPVPASYVLPAGLDMEFASSVVRINGAGASGTFVVVLDVLSQDGKLMASARTDQEFAAGDTGVVSFAPFLRRLAASGAGGALQSLKGSSSTNIGTSTTQIDYSATSDTRSDGSYFDFTGPGNLRILAPGVYLLVWQSISWTKNAAAVCVASLSAVVVAGSTGGWTVGQFATDGISSQIGLLLPNLGPAAADADLQPSPDGIAGLAVDSTMSYPIEIQTEYQYTEDGVGVVNNTPIFFLGVIRLGDCFE